MADVVLYEITGRVATVTLHRPDARNALSAEMRRVLRARLSDAEADKAVDVVILTGADPAFCAGLDLKELGSGDRGSDDDAVGFDGSGPLPPMTTPVIGAVNGVAVTGGLELALACDFLVASERARFADTHSRVGIQPGWGLTVRLPAAVGVRRAKEMSATGNFVDADTALVWGLVNHVVAHDDLLPFSRGLAADIASNDPDGVRRLLQTYDEGALVTDAEALRLEAQVGRDWLRSGAGAAQDVEARRRSITERGRAQAQ